MAFDVVDLVNRRGRGQDGGLNYRVCWGWARSQDFRRTGQDLASRQAFAGRDRRVRGWGAIGKKR